MVNIFFILNVIVSVFACRMVRFGVGVGNHERRSCLDPPRRVKQLKITSVCKKCSLFSGFKTLFCFLGVTHNKKKKKCCKIGLVREPGWLQEPL